MKYENEKMFVENFAKHVKTEKNFCVNGKEFTAEYAGKNSGAQAVYYVEIDGLKKNMNITQLKKRLGVTYTRECSRTGEAKTATRFVEKSDTELVETAQRLTDRVMQAYKVITTVCNNYNLTDNQILDYCAGGMDTSICNSFVAVLRDRQQAILQERAAKAEQAAKEKAELEAQLEAAMNAKDYKRVAELSQKLSKY